jgi:hypothetical protein
MEFVISGSIDRRHFNNVHFGPSHLSSNTERPNKQQHSTPNKGRTEHNRLKRIIRQDEYIANTHNAFTDQPPKQPMREGRYVTK